MRHAVIMAGGAGTRLWPLSRRNRPKQLLKLFDGKSLLQHARARLEGVFDAANTWVITSATYIDLVAEELPDLPRENLIGEPTGRDTANAIGLAAHLLAQRDPDATMAVFTADHLIEPRDAFQNVIRCGLQAAEQHPDSLVTFGVMPTEPHTGYGYIHLGEPVGDGVYRVRAFKEKPTREVAEQYLRSGEYLWHSGMFVWKVAAILGELSRCLPENHATLARLVADWSHLRGSDEGRRLFEGLYRISIDFGVMGKARRVLVVRMPCRWMDVGSWTSIAATRQPDEAGNVLLAPNSLLLDAHGNILVSEGEHLLVALGVRDLIVVHSDDATLVCRCQDAERVKQIVDLCRRRHGERYE